MLRPALQRICMACLLALAIVWLFQAVWHSLVPEWDFRGLLAGTILSAMIALLALACVVQVRAIRLVGVILGVLLAFREYLMLTESNVPLRELLSEPGGWIGPALMGLFLFASVIALSGKRGRV